jgi:hypothetical protein
MGQRRGGMAQPGGVVAQVVGQQVACRRRRGRRPRRRGPGGRAGREIQQRREGGQARGGVADEVVDLDEQAEGWQLEQPQPGVLVWRTPAGRSYATTPTVYQA